MAHDYKGKTRGTEAEIASDMASVTFYYVDVIYGTRTQEETNQIIKEMDSGLYRQMRKALDN